MSSGVKVYLFDLVPIGCIRGYANFSLVTLSKSFVKHIDGVMMLTVLIQNCKLSELEQIKLWFVENQIEVKVVKKEVTRTQIQIQALLPSYSTVLYRAYLIIFEIMRSIGYIYYTRICLLQCCSCTLCISLYCKELYNMGIYCEQINID